VNESAYISIIQKIKQNYKKCRNAALDSLLGGVDVVGRLRLIAANSVPSRVWINALPSATLGQQLEKRQGTNCNRCAGGGKVNAAPSMCLWS